MAGHVGRVVAEFMSSRRDDEAYGKAMRDLGYSAAEVNAYQELRTSGVNVVADAAQPIAGQPSEWCVKCGQARGVLLEDGTLDWITKWQAPRDCEHELPAVTP